MFYLMPKEIFGIPTDELFYRLQVLVLTFWFIKLLFLNFKKVESCKLSDYILYISPFLVLGLSFFIDKKFIVLGIIILYSLLIVIYLVRKIYEAKW
ncbi:hypothetical protein CGC48_05840 [Capnocytophaga cynodegmi]|uniref:Uncharacterized protein n=1 Tax=Capnocytophaga cynodegmi TaxID=28189 RepID=A0A250E5K2_9FLAO|nr:hypothetical protein CGC48_05840 [Capnocytophaga cynodegmi]